MNNNWIITDKMYLYLSLDGEKVSIANPESKKYWGPVQKISETLSQPLTVDNTGSEIMISDGRVYLKVSGKYLKISNLSTENLIYQISEATLTDGKATGVIFGFSQYTPDKTILVFPGTHLYKKTEEEFLRNVNLSLCKKTSKYIPGHRYDTKSGSFWYIGEYLSCQGDDRDYWADDYSTNKRVVSQVFSNYLPPSKKLSDLVKDCEVFRTTNLETYPIKSYPKSIIFLSKGKSMVDAGEELDIDITLDQAYELRVSEFEKSGLKAYTFGSRKFYYPEFSRMMSIFDLVEPSTKIPKLSITVLEGIKRVVLSNINYVIFKYYDSKKDDSDSVYSRLRDTFFAYRSELYANSCKYRVSQLEVLLGKNLLDLVRESIRAFKVPEFNDFSDYLDNIGYYQHRSQNYDKTIDFVYVNRNDQKISKYLPDSPLRDLLVEMYKEALDTNGAYLRYFNLENVGTQANPVIKYTFTISLEDIMRHYGITDPNKIPEGVKDDLLGMKIHSVIFITRSDINPRLDE